MVVTMIVHNGTTEVRRWTESVSANIRAEMARKRVSYKDLADSCRMPVYTIRRRMSGASRTFTLDELHIIAEALGVPLSRLLWEGR